jgi:electron transfer flavoprotein-quinone oxidoreductase
MTRSKHDVIVVGAGCAGLTAAIALARAGFAVFLVEAAAAGGGGNPTGGVYFAENLAHPDVLGPHGMAGLPWERRLVSRGRFVTDGRAMLGLTYHDPAAFQHCYTVRRPTLDRSLTEHAVRQGAAFLPGMRVESLIRDSGRVVGVCTTQGPLYASLVFLAEGDAAHLVSREGLERSPDPRDAPHFLLGMQVDVDLSPGAVEERFGVGPGEGVAYDFLVRNGSVSDRNVPLNMRGFLCTNRQGLTLAVTASLENLRRHFPANPLALLEWLAGVPALRAWLDGAHWGGFSVRLIRGGGARDVPHLVADGLAVGGAAASLGISFPFMNFTGPATASGLLLAHSAVRIRAEGGTYSREALTRHYVEPLTHTTYWQDLEHLRRWPAFLRKTQAIFGRDIDLALGTAEVWTRPRHWLPVRAMGWLRLLGRSGGWALVAELRDDLRALTRALRSRGVLGRPGLGRLLLDGSLNALRDLGGRARQDVPPAGTLKVYYKSGAEEGDDPAPRFVRRWLDRFRPVLAAVLAEVVRNDRVRVAEKLSRAARLLIRQINILDLQFVAVLGVLTALAGGLAGFLRRPGRHKQTNTVPQAMPAAQSPKMVDPGPLPSPLLHLLWPRTLPVDESLQGEALPGICPAGVFEVSSTTEVTVHAERCLACEACWRTSRLVDWVPGMPEASSGPSHSSQPAASIAGRLDRIEAKLDAYDAALSRGPIALDRAAADHLEILARYVHRQATELAALLTQRAAPSDLVGFAHELASKAESRMRLTWDGHFAWAAADGRQLRWHHLALMRDKADSAKVEAEPSRSVARSAGSDSARFVDASLNGVVGAAAALAERLYHNLLGHGVSTQVPKGLSPDSYRLLVAGAGAGWILLAALDSRPPRDMKRSDAHLRAALLEAVASETLDTLVHSTAGLGALTDEFRQGGERLLAAAPSPASAYRRYARRLADGWEKARAVLEVEGDFAELVQRQALLPEWEEVQRSEARLRRLAEAWETERHAVPEDAPLDAEIAEVIARQESRLAACKFLLGYTHALLETRPDAEVEMALVRVVLDDSAADLDVLGFQVQRRLEPGAQFRQRPLIEPGFDPPAATLEEYLSAPDPYHSGDFLLAPVDLIRPRLTPEMLGARPLPPTPADLGGLAATVDHLAHLVELCRQTTPARCRSQAEEKRGWAIGWRLQRMEEDLFIASAMTCATAGCAAHPAPWKGDLELGCARFMAERLRRHAGRLAREVLPHEGHAPEPGAGFAQERAAVLGQLRETLRAQSNREAMAQRVRHVGPEALELEAVKTEVRRQVETVLGLLAGARRLEPGLRLLGLAMAGAVSWLWAADCTLGRLAWIGRVRLAQAPDDPLPLPSEGRRAFARCLDETRSRVQRLDEDLAALRRGYWPPQARAAAILLSQHGVCDVE